MLLAVQFFSLVGKSPSSNNTDALNDAFEKELNHNMPRYNLPDGRYVDVPADADRDYYIRLQNTLAQEYPDNFTQYQEPTETTLGGNVLEVAKGIMRIRQGLLSGLKGVVNIFDVGNDSTRGDSLRNAQDFIGELEGLKPAKGYEDKFSTQFGQGLGSFASFLTPVLLLENL